LALLHVSGPTPTSQLTRNRSVTFRATGITRSAARQNRTLDGFGRVIQVDSGSGTVVSLANTVSRVLTQYAPCACSPLLKLWRTSTPFNPNPSSPQYDPQAPYWTTYTYDSSGRTISVTAPDGNSTSTYSYSGNNTTTTDPAGRWKTQATDAFGNLITVTEPNPAGGNFTTTYSYSPLNQLLQVTMPRGSTTQTRTFTYNGQDMVSATNPENGTVTYTYDASHRVLTRTDAKNQQTKYIYNTLGQRTQVLHGTLSNGTFTQDTTSTVNYTYDTYGRTSQVQFGAKDLNFARTFTYGYTYMRSLFRYGPLRYSIWPTRWRVRRSHSERSASSLNRDASGIE